MSEQKLDMFEYRDFGLWYLLSHWFASILGLGTVDEKATPRTKSRDKTQGRIQQLEQLLNKAQSEIERLHIEKQLLEGEKHVLESEKHVLESEKQDAFNRNQNQARVQKQLEQLLEKAHSEIDRFHAEKQMLESEKQDALSRLSKLMSSKLRDKNPNIADLSDKFRPTKIGELFTELYDNQWTDAFSALERHYDEKKGITFLLDIIMEAYVFCEKELTESWNYVQKFYITEGDTVTAKSLKDARKNKVLDDIAEKERDLSKILSTHYKEYLSFENNDAIQKYIKECVLLCLLMNANDPPVVIECPGWQSRFWTPDQTSMSIVNGKPTSWKATVVIGIDEQPIPRQDFDRAVFKEYTSRGPYVEYIVWPIMYLHRNGPMLAKGIAQGSKMKNSPPTNTELSCVVDVHV